MQRGDHIYVSRGSYAHHGVYIGEGRVIDLSSANGTKRSSQIREVGLQEFAEGGLVRVRDYGLRFAPDEVVARARSRLGQSDYDVCARNCEHFASWCVCGDHSSAQVEAAASGVGLCGIGVIAPQAGVGLVVNRGQAAALSGPNLMSGLARVGGGSALSGVALVSGVPALLACAGMYATSLTRPRSSARHAETGATAPLAEPASASQPRYTRSMPWESPDTAPPASVLDWHSSARPLGAGWHKA
jgi:hypothetical protein